MAMKKVSLLIFLTLSLIAWVAYGQELYKWVDDKGTVHFTDNPSLVPQKYQDQIQTQTPPGPTSPPSQATSAPSQATPPRAPAPATEASEPSVRVTDRLGRDEQWWRAKAKEWNDKLVDAQKKLDELKKELKTAEDEAGVKYNVRHMRRQVLRPSEEEMKGLEDQIAEAKNMLENVLPKEAAADGADPSWLRP
jgi:Domain of unknown function (DUF4124)